MSFSGKHYAIQKEGESLKRKAEYNVIHGERK